MPNFKLIREDRKNNTNFAGSIIHVHKTLTISKLHWFEKLYL